MHYGIAIELRADCQSCGQPMHFNALVEEIACKSCHTPLRFGWEQWKSLLSDAFDEAPDYEIGRGGRTQTFGAQANTNLMYARFDPYCFDCKTAFDMAVVTTGSADAVACSKCNEQWHVRRLPPELATYLPGVSHLLAEDERLLPGGPAHAGPAPAASQPIVFVCPACGGALRVDGSDRVIACQYCSASVYLPDDLWHRLHPPDKVRRWFLWCETARARDPARFPVDDDTPRNEADAPVEAMPARVEAMTPPMEAPRGSPSADGELLEAETDSPRAANHSATLVIAILVAIAIGTIVLVGLG